MASTPLPLPLTRFIGQCPDGTSGRWPTFIEPALWERVQARLALHRGAIKRATGTWLLSGILLQQPWPVWTRSSARRPSACTSSASEVR